ncbi:DMT family transporter [Bartonella sp. HY761]|nr:MULTISPECIES: DMT family transporter [unclassified Bartonella]UXN03386.1 DMT family transporter [Bartonella sp. HY406]UXN06345.1 DMT family transporter [Bartonella sp. HY761]
MKLKRPSFTANSIALGVILMILGQFMFAANDTMGKILVQGFAVGQLIVFRSIGAFIILTPMLSQKKPQDIIKPPRPYLLALRGLCSVGDAVFFYSALIYLPLTDVMTFYMAVPIYVAVFSHFFLGERIAWRRWLAICIGFVGVVIAMRPSTNMISLPSAFALFSSFCFTFVLILGRSLRSTSDTISVAWQNSIALVIGLFMIVGHWQTPDFSQSISLLLLGIVACIAHLLISRSLKMAPASVLAPLQYTMLLWGIIFDIVIFKHYPDAMILLGAGIIVLAGLFIFHRKKVVTDHIPKSDVPNITH